jgi:biuret amidohydrolase
MPTSYREMLSQFVDRSNSYIKTVDRKRTVLHMLDVQNLCLDPKGADYIRSVGGAPSGADTLGPAKKALERCREEGFPVLWSLWGIQPDGSDAGIGKFKAPGMCDGTPDAPGSHGTWNGALVDGFVPRPGEHVFQKHRYSSFYGTAFNEYLTEHDAKYLVICGSSTANCVQTTAMNGWERNYRVIVLADTGTAIPFYRKGSIPLQEQDVPLGYGQHWEALRTIQASYGDVMTHEEFFELLDRS